MQEAVVVGDKLEDFVPLKSNVSPIVMGRYSTEPFVDFGKTVKRESKNEIHN